MVTTRPPKTIVKPTALGPVANTDTKLLIYGLFQKGQVLAQDGFISDAPDWTSTRNRLRLARAVSSLARHVGSEAQRSQNVFTPSGSAAAAGAAVTCALGAPH